MRVIPAIDLKDGRCVRLRQGDMAAETVYFEDVPEVARRWQQQGADLIHVVDLNGAVDGDAEESFADRSGHEDGHREGSSGGWHPYDRHGTTVFSGRCGAGGIRNGCAHESSIPGAGLS